MVKKHQENLRENSYYANSMRELLVNGVDTFTGYEQTLNNLTANDIRTIFADLLKQNNDIKVVMVGVTK